MVENMAQHHFTWEIFPQDRDPAKSPFGCRVFLRIASHLVLT